MHRKCIIQARQLFFKEESAIRKEREYAKYLINKNRQSLLLVANDAVAKDEFRQGLMNMAAPAYAQTRYFSIQKTIDIIGKASPAQKIFIICETPQDVLRLVEGGVPIKKCNIGNMHMSEGKRQVATTVAVNDDDVAAFKKLQELGVELEIQRVPDIAPEDINKLWS